MNELEQYGSPIIEEQRPAPRLISRRLYNAILTGLVVLSFVVMAACSQISNSLEFLIFMSQHAMAYMLVTLLGTFGGIIVMSIGRAKENLPMASIGYVLFTLTMGFTTSLALGAYSLPTIQTAFTATAGIMVVFGLAGMMFPNAFAKIQGVLCVGLLGIIVIELVLSLLGIQQTITDYAVILLFCGFIGYDVYRASTALPTFTNALWYAVDLYLDIINVFLRLLALFGRRD